MRQGIGGSVFYKASLAVISANGPLTRYIKLRVAHAPGILGTFPPPPLFKGNKQVSDPSMHHGTCSTHVPWCMSGSLTRGGREMFLAFSSHAQPEVLRMRPWLVMSLCYRRKLTRTRKDYCAIVFVVGRNHILRRFPCDIHDDNDNI